MRATIARLKALLPARRALWTGALFAAGVGAGFYLVTENWIESDASARFANHAVSGRDTLAARIKSYTDLLRAAASMFHANPEVTRAQFHDYVGGLNLREQYPAVEVINYAEYVLDADRDKVQQHLREEYAPERGKPSDFSISPPGRRPRYNIVTMAEPGSWLNIVGLDISGRPSIAPAMDAQRDSGELSHSGQPIPAITGPNRTGLGIRLPIYRANMPITNVEQRRAAYIGSMGIAFSVPKLVKDVLDNMRIKNVRMTLLDVSQGPQSSTLPALGGGRVLFDSSGSDQDPAPALDADDGLYFTRAVTTNFHGRTWKAIFSTRKSDFYTRLDTWFPLLSLFIGAVSAGLLYALFHTLSSSRQRALRMAEGMTSELRDSEARLKRSHDQLRRLAAHAEQIKEGERKRIAREIHDDLGQNLLALRIEADMLSLRTGNHHPRLHARAALTVSQIDSTIKSVRQIINDLRPTVLDLGLAAAVEWQIGEFRRRTGIACRLVGDNIETVSVSDECATAFFRILQESLSNVTRHAQATVVSVELRLEPQRLSMTVADNGVGMPSKGARSGSFGLVGIEERINLLHGTFLIRSAPGEGTVLSVSVPVNNGAPHGLAEAKSGTGHPLPVI